jgi:endonuclease/exonuclease/phosphatase family metal-dependent hydrolase
MIGKVMTFNLRYNEPKDGENAWPYRVKRVTQTIQEHDPILFGTQEGYYAMLMELHHELPAYNWIGTGRFGEHEDEHNAIFYKKDQLEVLEEGHFWLSDTPEVVATKSWDSMFPRMCTWIRFKDKNSHKVFVVYNTHLDHRSQEARENGVKVIWDYMATHQINHPLPVILMGDMNSHPSNATIRYLSGESKEEGPKGWLKDAYSLLEGEIGRTAHDFKGGADEAPIDYIFVSPEVELLETIVDRRQIGGGYPSDHYPIIAAVCLS